MESEGGLGFWALAIVGGPIVLGLIIAYGVLQSRRKSGRSHQLTERTTEQNYRAEERRAETLEREDRT